MESASQPLLAAHDRLQQLANHVGALFGMLGIRLLLSWEYGEAGLTKFRGDNWFGNVHSEFPMPFDLLPVELNWLLATWSELLGAVALALGLATRFFGISLFILTVVAWISVHSGNGYNVCYNGFKLPLIYLVMLVPLILSGPGKLSLDYWWQNRRGKTG
ncbi:MAG TPA: DoxX family protein [Burkholderiales bacterium]|nr:DoxX family protein [Burkholderiales bacterium]